jgi:hypothetical protein
VYQHDGTLNPNKPTNFNGEPRADLDEAWTNLTNCTNRPLNLRHDIS